MSSVDNNAAESNNDATNVPNQDEATEAQEQPRLVVTIDEEQVVVEPGDLGDENLRADLIRRCEQAARTVEFAAEDLFAWPDLPRSILLQILHGLGQQARLRVGCDEAEHPNPFEAIVANLAGADDIQRCTASQRGAIEAAALFLPQDSWQAAASRIAAGLREAGVEGVRAPRIFKAIQNVAASPTTADAATAAADFHNALRATLQLAGHDPAIRYFQDDFYAWNGRYWQRLDNSELEARVTQHVQEAGQLSVTKKLIADVVTNLKGQTFLQDWHRQMPFWIEAEQTQPETGTPPLVVFENGLIDLQEALDGEIPWLYEHDVNCFSTVMLPYEYDPLATCPLWLETLAQIFPSEGRDDHRIEVLQEFMGLTFFPRDTRFETFLIFVGKGANGKSTILRTWEALLGPQNVTHVPLDALGGEFRLYDMQGKVSEHRQRHEADGQVGRGPAQGADLGRSDPGEPQVQVAGDDGAHGQVDLCLQRAAADQRPLGRHLAADNRHALERPVCLSPDGSAAGRAAPGGTARYLQLGYRGGQEVVRAERLHSLLGLRTVCGRASPAL